MVYDVIIIGAGVTGAFAARELSRYKVSVCLVDKEADVSCGTSKANSAVIHAGFDAKYGSLKAKLNLRGSKLMGQLAKELAVPYKEIGSLVLCFDINDMHKLQELKENGERNGVEGLTIFTGEQLHKLEPNISKMAIAALHAPTAGIICPYELTLAAAENAVENGAHIKLEREIKSIDFKDDRFILKTGFDELESRYVINAAGLFAGVISNMAGDAGIAINPRKGQYMLFDKAAGNRVNKVIFQLPSNKGKGILVTPTVDGNLLIGPDAEETDDREDLTTTQAGLKQVLEAAKASVPDLNVQEIITSFAGLRAGTSQGDFIIRASGINNKLIHAAGIESPGLTAAPAIGEMLVELLRAGGLALIPKTTFNPIRKTPVNFKKIDEFQLNALVKNKPAYGRIVCRCEKVTEGEVIACIHSVIGAKNLDGVKRRTRAGMGRCQGGFCTPRIVEILSRELGIPMDEVTKNGGGSKLLAGKIK